MHNFSYEIGIFFTFLHVYINMNIFFKGYWNFEFSEGWTVMTETTVLAKLGSDKNLVRKGTSRSQSCAKYCSSWLYGTSSSHPEPINSHFCLFYFFLLLSYLIQLSQCSAILCKGGIISERFSLWLHPPKNVPKCDKSLYWTPLFRWKSSGWLFGTVLEAGKTFWD